LLKNHSSQGVWERGLLRIFILTNLLPNSWERAMMILGKWRSPVEDDLKKNVMTEYKAIVAKLSECHATVKELTPRHDVLAKLIETYGWQGEIEKLELDDDFTNNPDVSKSKGQKIAELSTNFFHKNNNQWTPLSELYLYLTDRGIRIGGKNPNSTLSAHLSNSNLFEGTRTKGWRLKPEHARIRTRLHEIGVNGGTQ
jgi:hypothetical protein